MHGLEARGFSVEVFSVMTAEEYRQPRGFFGNFWRRWQLYGGMSLRTRRQVCRPVKEPTCRIVTTNPFFLPDMVQTRSLFSPNVRLLNFVLDLYPEALVLAGRHIGSKAKCKLEAMAGRAIQKCDASIFLGEKLRKYAIDKYGPAKETKVIPVGADARPFAGMTPKSIPVGSPVRFL